MLWSILRKSGHETFSEYSLMIQSPELRDRFIDKFVLSSQKNNCSLEIKGIHYFSFHH